VAVGTQDLKFRVLAQVLGGQAIDQLGGSLNSLNNQARTVTTALKALAAVYSAKEAIDFGKNILEAGDSLNKLSAKTGASVEQLAKLQEQASLADVPFEGLTNALKKLSVNMIEANNGNTELRAAFKNLGVSVIDSNGHVKTAGDVLEQLQGSFGRFKDGPEKAALAVKLFGKSGSDLIPLLNGASGEVSSFARALDSDFAARAEQFNDSIKMIGLNLKGQALVGLKTIIPTLQELANAFNDFVKSTDSSSFEIIGETIRTFSIGAVVSISGIAIAADTTVTAMRQLKAALTLSFREMQDLGTDWSQRWRKRAQDVIDFTMKATKNSTWYGQGADKDILSRRSKETAIDPKNQAHS
jgi:hypothetical protein